MDDTRLKRIEDKIDHIGDTQGEMNVTLAKQHESLKSHMRRTAALEAIVEPLHKRSVMLDGAWKLIALLAMAAEIYHFFR
jgi:hypothetical protein